METVEKGVIRNTLVKGDCISKAARRQSASDGMIRLVMIPTLIAVVLLNKAPNLFDPAAQKRQTI